MEIFPMEGNNYTFDTFDPSQSKLVPSQMHDTNTPNCAFEQIKYINGDQFEFDPAQNKLLPKTVTVNTGYSTTSKRLYRTGEEFDFDPVSSRLVPKPDEMENHLRNPASGIHHTFDHKTEKRLKGKQVETGTRGTTRKDKKQVPVINRQGREGFF
jgi:hypothetical protein